MKVIAVLNEFNNVSVIVRLLLAMILGGCIGMDRAEHLVQQDNQPTKSLKNFIFIPCVEARAILCYAWNIPVSHNLGMGIIFFQPLHQFQQGFLLGVGTGIGRLSVRIQSSFVTHPDGSSVISRRMCPLLVERASCMHRSITCHVVMIAHGSESPGTVTGYHHLQRERPVTTGGTAMNHNQVNSPVVLVLAAV